MIFKFCCSSLCVFQSNLWIPKLRSDAQDPKEIKQHKKRKKNLEIMR